MESGAWLEDYLEIGKFGLLLDTVPDSLVYNFFSLVTILTELLHASYCKNNSLHVLSP